MKSQKRKFGLLCCMTLMVSCGQSDRKESPNVIDRSVLSTLTLKDCGNSPCADDPCASRLKVDHFEASQIESLVQNFNDKVCKERPWRGYLLTEAIVRESIEVQLDEIPDLRRLDFKSLMKNDLKKQVDLEFFSKPLQYFFPRLSIMDAPQPVLGGGSVQHGYSLRVGNDIQEVLGK